MSKTDWGIKRECLSCHAVFYDLKKSPIICPKCGEEYDPNEANSKKSRRGKSAAKAAPVAAKKPAPESEDDLDDLDIDLDIELDDDDEGGIEDVNELEEDDDVDVVIDIDNNDDD